MRSQVLIHVAVRCPERYARDVSSDRRFWKDHPGLVWSNPDASDDVFIRAALVRPRFLQLLDIVEKFGIERVEEQWRILELEGSEEARRAIDTVERILRNIHRGMAVASANH